MASDGISLTFSILTIIDSPSTECVYCRLLCFLVGIAFLWCFLVGIALITLLWCLGLFRLLEKSVEM